ncbi:MAG: type IV secretory system conjugative DNA transfer family protein [bacterium]|nr:type IV secretory system conjugative DNA transfer family protein [bacterium]
MPQNFIDTLILRATTFTISLFIFLLSLAGLAFLAWLFFLWLKYRNRENRSLSMVTFEVLVPKDNEIKIDAAEQMFTSFASLTHTNWLSRLFKHPRHLTLEIVATKENIGFYLSVPEEDYQLIEKQIYGAYPEAHIKIIEDHNIFTKDGHVAFSALKTKKPTFWPLKTYKEMATDSIASMTSAMAKLTEGEGILLQIVITPTSHRWQNQGKGWIANKKKEESDPEKAKYNIDPKTYEAIENKCSKPGFTTDIRLVVVSPKKDRAQAHLKEIIATFSQFQSPYNSFTTKKIWFKKMFMLDVIYRYLPFFGQTSILNTEELASIYHFPNKTVETPFIHWLLAKRAPAPPEIPSSGLFLGYNRFRGISRPIYIQDKDRQRHMYIIGKTGTGKSQFLLDMMLQDIRNGKGICFIDPHDTIEVLLELIPPNRAEDVIYFDPSDLQRPMGLNLLEFKTEDQKQFIASAIINMMYKLFDPHKTGIVGPRFEHAVRNAILTITTEPGASFVEVVRVLTDDNYLRYLLPKVKDPMVRRYWTDQVAKTSDFHKSEVLDYIVSKFGRFVTNPMMRNIIGQSKSAFDFRKVMDEGKILLINLAKGKIGEENSSFLGLVLVPRLLMAAMSRQDVPEEQRRDFYLYVDEFQNFATPDFAQILSEARKYHLNLTVANQFIGQMDDEVKNAIFGNVGTLVSFRVGVTDANYLQNEFAPVFNQTDLINIEKFNAYIKTIVGNQPVSPFSLDLTKDMAAQAKIRNPKIAEMIKELSRLKYGRDRYEVERQIAQRARL